MKQNVGVALESEKEEGANKHYASAPPNKFQETNFNFCIFEAPTSVVK